MKISVNRPRHNKTLKNLVKSTKYKKNPTKLTKMEAPSHPTQESIIYVSPETESDQELRELKREYWKRRLVFWRLLRNRRNLEVSDETVRTIAITICLIGIIGFIVILGIVLIVIFVNKI